MTRDCVDAVTTEASAPERADVPLLSGADLVSPRRATHNLDRPSRYGFPAHRAMAEPSAVTHPESVRKSFRLYVGSELA
jgi:hypothetical protein